MSQTIHCDAAGQQSIPLPVRPHTNAWIGWLPLLLLPSAAIVLGAAFPPWVFMWLLAVAIFAGCKWETWCEARWAGIVAASLKRRAAYLLLWPGMEPHEFFSSAVQHQIRSREWLWGIAKTFAGLALIWIGARMISLGHPMLGGWAGMIGLALFLHFGTFHVLALAWRRAGLPVKLIMQRPLASRSLSEFWGKRWNLGFRSLSHKWVFQQLQHRFGVAIATLGAFLASGLLHDLVISVPARAGYGLPTAYFLAQGLGVLVARSQTGKRWGLGRGAAGWLWTALVAGGRCTGYFIRGLSCA